MEKELINIDFGAFVRVVKKEIWWIILITALITISGIAYALLAREEFTTQGKILPELQGKTGGGLSQFAGLASLAGVDLSSLGGSGVDAIRPDLYPDVITSTPFYIELFKSDVHTKDNRKMSFEKYYHLAVEDNVTPKDKLLNKYPVKEEGIIVINRLSEIRLKDMRERITANIDKRSGVISITAKMPDPVVAAEVTRFAMQHLMDYVKSYRTEKLRKDLNYLADQVVNSKAKYYSSQEKKARYSDQFQATTIRLQTADVQRERIESEYKLSSSFHNELLKKYEEAKFKLHQETPIFKVLEPPVAPVKRTEPKRSIIALMSMFFGVVLALGVVLIKGGNYRLVLSR